LTKSCRF